MSSAFVWLTAALLAFFSLPLFWAYYGAQKGKVLFYLLLHGEQSALRLRDRGMGGLLHSCLFDLERDGVVQSREAPDGTRYRVRFSEGGALREMQADLDGWREVCDAQTLADGKEIVSLRGRLDLAERRLGVVEADLLQSERCCRQQAQALRRLCETLQASEKEVRRLSDEGSISLKK